MGQQEVYDYLKKNKGKWFTIRDLAKGLKVSVGSATCNMQKMRRSYMVNYRETSRKNQFEYRFKR